MAMAMHVRELLTYWKKNCEVPLRVKCQNILEPTASVEKPELH
mgnify:CR=1 FL=1